MRQIVESQIGCSCLMEMEKRVSKKGWLCETLVLKSTLQQPVLYPNHDNHVQKLADTGVVYEAKIFRILRFMFVNGDKVKQQCNY
jgi:hypothetical protein